MTKRSWQEKLRDSKDLPKIVKMSKEQAKKWGGETLAIPSPLEIDELMKKVPKGKVTTVAKLREKIAKKHKAKVGCPLTCGIFSWIAAYAAEEARAEGKKSITPWWRTLKGQGELNPKYPGGEDTQMKKLKAEGIIFEQKGKKAIVKDLEKYLI
ncbi:MAG: MGMT family protein [Candidatus Berkelbacteria bacterium]|nr:MGMT family protein [Candidatus Berkelbacteria bacterium]